MLEAGLLRGWPGAERHNTGQSVPCCSTAHIFSGRTSHGGALTECVSVAKLPPPHPDNYLQLRLKLSSFVHLYFVTNREKKDVLASCVRLLLVIVKVHQLTKPILLSVT